MLTYCSTMAGRIWSENWPQAGHWKSPNSTIFTGASSDPSRTGTACSYSSRALVTSISTSSVAAEPPPLTTA